MKAYLLTNEDVLRNKHTLLSLLLNIKKKYKYKVSFEESDKYSSDTLIIHTDIKHSELIKKLQAHYVASGRKVLLLHASLNCDIDVNSVMKEVKKLPTKTTNNSSKSKGTPELEKIVLEFIENCDDLIVLNQVDNKVEKRILDVRVKQLKN